MYQREKSCDPSLHGTLMGPTNRYVHVKITIHGGNQMKPYSEVESLFSNFHRYWFGRLFFSCETWWNMIKHDEPYPISQKRINSKAIPSHIVHILHIPHILSHPTHPIHPIYPRYAAKFWYMLRMRMVRLLDCEAQSGVLKIECDHVPH